jgi:hypothetical protein
MAKGTKEASITIIDGFHPAEKGTKAIIAISPPVKKHWWSKPVNYGTTRVLFWANFAFATSDSRTGDRIVPIVRFGGHLVPAHLLPGYVGFIHPGEPDGLYAEEADEFIANAEKAEAEAEAKRRETLN